MGWEGDEPHTFIACDGERHTTPPFAPGTKDDRKTRIREVINQVGQSLTYHFGFAEDWRHEILLEKISFERLRVRPICLDGRRRCPPTDCGGPLGFKELLGRHDEVRSSKPWNKMIESRVELFRPTEFDRSAVNAALRGLGP